MDSIKMVLDYLKDIAPFSALTGAIPMNQNKVLIQRISEMVIVIAATVGMIYGILTIKFEVFEKSLTEVKQDIKQLRRDLYIPRSSGGNKGP